MKNRYSYDAWGRPRNPSTWELMPIGISDALINNLNAMQPRFDRGYTGHEQMAGFGLINMNGRLYDPYLQRFLSPDNVVQAPDNAQNYNRYSYCLNNPLMYTDPSGWQSYAADYYISPDYYNYMEGASSGRKGNGSGSYGSAAGSLGYTYLKDGSYMDRATGDIVAWETVYNNYVVPNSASPKSINNDPILSKYFFCVGKATIKANGDVMQNDNGNKYAFQLFINDSPIAKFILIDINTPSGGGGRNWADHVELAGDISGPIGKGAENILDNRGAYMPKGQIYKMNREVTVRTPVGGINTTSRMLNYARVGGKVLGAAGFLATGYQVGNDVANGNYASAGARAAVMSVAFGASFIPVVGWGVAIGIGVADYVWGDQLYNSLSTNKNP